MKVPEIYIPLINAGLLRLWHDTIQYVFPPNSTLTVRWRPSLRMIYLVFGMTYGHPRDFNTGNVITSTNFGYRHEHRDLVWHWDPMTESIFYYRHPYHLKVTRDNPLITKWYNNTGLTMIQDFTIWLFECDERDWDEIEKYFDGIYLYYRGMIKEPEEEIPPSPPAPKPKEKVKEVKKKLPHPREIIRRILTEEG